MVAVATVIIAVVVSILIARVATVALSVTGLSRESARFQARSALTGTGFTTVEAERVVDHPIRRRIIMALMLIGNAGIVTIIGTLAISFTNVGDRGDAFLRLGLLLGGLLVVWAVARNDRVDRLLTQAIARLLREYTDLDTRDYARLLKLSGDYAVTEMTVDPDDWIVTETLADRRLTDEGIIVLGITRPDGSYVGVPRGDTPVRPGDTLILYGRAPLLAELDTRPTGDEGDEAHGRGVVDHRVVLNAEAFVDPARDQTGRDEQDAPPTVERR
ncbi:MAG TPA: TrkA C-terminal domain-containing protein [Nitriliruptorales bacterium]|nr:TrkA C-terminal domain-containing protein [Nitriliruptorales bacterium]